MDKKLLWLYAFLIPIEIVVFLVVLDNPQMLLFVFAFIFNLIIIVNPFYGLVTLLLVCPIYDPKVLVFVNVYAHTLLIILTFFSLIINVTIGRIKIKFNVYDVAFSFLTITIIISVLNSEKFLRSVKASLDILQFIIAFAVFSKLIKSSKQIFLLLDCLVISTPIAVLMGLFNSTHYRGGGYVIHNPNDYASYLLMVSLIFLGMVLVSPAGQFNDLS